GAVERTREQPGLIVSRIMTLEQAQRELTKRLVLILSHDVHDPNHIDALVRVLQRSPGSCPVYLNILDAAGKRSLLKAGEDFRINPATVSTGELETILGPGRIKFSGNTNGNGNGRWFNGETS